MRILIIDEQGGVAALGPMAITWGNADPDYQLNGFCSFGFGHYALEFGDIDQGIPGIYLTHYSDGDIEYTRPLIQFK